MSDFKIAIPAVINMGASDAAQKEHIPALVGIIVCGVAFVLYAYYQLYSSRAQTAQAQMQARLKFDRWKQSVGRSFGTTS